MIGLWVKVSKHCDTRTIRLDYDVLMTEMSQIIKGNKFNALY